MSDVRVVTDEKEVRVLRKQARITFIHQLGMYGLTVLPEYQDKWWPYT